MAPRQIYTAFRFSPEEHTLNDREAMARSIELARRSDERGNHPFGCVITANGDLVAESENTVVTGRDCTGHAETNLMRLASQHFSEEQLGDCTLYTSTEPCAMCAGAIFWGNVRRVVYALSEVDLYELAGSSPENL